MGHDNFVGFFRNNIFFFLSIFLFLFFIFYFFIFVIIIFFLIGSDGPLYLPLLYRQTFKILRIGKFTNHAWNKEEKLVPVMILNPEMFGNIQFLF